MSVMCFRDDEWNKSQKIKAGAMKNTEFQELEEKEASWYG